MEHQLTGLKSFESLHSQQNIAELGNALKSLNEFYKDARTRGNAPSPAEAEIRAYYILLTMDNDEGLEVHGYLQGLGPALLRSPEVQFAVRAFVARRAGDWAAFFRL
ncbi:unnamed protein product, partial [Heterosigma akashiwo]